MSAKRPYTRRKPYSPTCRRGHVYDKLSTYIRPDGRRECRPCREIAIAKLDAAKPVAERKEQRTHCKRGHEFTAENTGRNTRGNRLCIACRTLIRAKANAEARQRRADLRLASPSSACRDAAGGLSPVQGSPRAGSGRFIKAPTAGAAPSPLASTAGERPFASPAVRASSSAPALGLGSGAVPPGKGVGADPLSRRLA